MKTTASRELMTGLANVGGAVMVFTQVKHGGVPFIVALAGLLLCVTSSYIRGRTYR